MSEDHPHRTPPASDPVDVTVVVLAGGTSRRCGADKLGARLHGSTVLETVVRSLPESWPVVVVGPSRECGRAVSWTREDPPGGGPLAGVAAGVLLVRTPVVAVVAGDMPFAGSAVERLVGVLRTAPPDVGAAVATDPGGFSNPLLGAYRTDAVRAVLPVPSADRPAKLLLAVPHVEVVVTGPAGRDVDTPADLEALTDPT
jgi:molybdopterin-guanine dinucleotide biosynthesis protein A